MSKSSRKITCLLPSASNQSGDKRGELQLKKQGPGEQTANEAITVPDLKLDETVRIREMFTEYINGEYVTTLFDLRVLLSELGVYPSDDEMTLVMTAFENKVSFTNLCRYMRFYKKEFLESNKQRHRSNAAQDECEDTLRAFVSLGGNEDGSGSVLVEDLRQVCRNFGLTIDINEALNGLNESESPLTLRYMEFCNLWKHQSRERGGESGTIRSLSLTDTLYTSGGLDGEASNYIHLLNLLKPHVSNISYEQSTPAICTPLLARGDESDARHSLPKSDEKHLQELKRFLLPSLVGSAEDPDANSYGAQRDDGYQLPSLVQHMTPRADAEERQRPLRQRRTKEAAARRSAGNDDKSHPPTQGGFRAPSPMILSLRNLAAYRQRLQAFAKKKEKSRNRERGKGGHGVSSYYDDDGARI
ncbi:uncharacterized protein TEOVI_000376400 [Trypanosoma equiperdum]|uniref:EF-hand domain-containing protein n=4 Tax=Trypanozoon TaxID=39700 RepID=Q38F99_TRYB2|nr:hypothetical protein, conserved [Trypanosoma brucei gambiense DAL972]XP_803746.1 hypothetical protein, conserved [Trypanosoma brucei brucei TREU927]RHW70057.1 hypothetical protein DPX39_090018700 [Trypanosoma brucei equiperdum]SCU72188.1 hypothetical protein, conserved [Trypanosoma equiperdum]EAN76521.1 hypothetical protein, conserved [Trypanosoma brucei brucei TREU927]CBH14158.1 hypothetical protein, conserved [Trypanosoma brucei gambiense DAL972]|eukprot:XP_011776429.1 hypothetical protein, conserved [Trypanosoma brucei gambiense DAL972]